MVERSKFRLPALLAQVQNEHKEALEGGNNALAPLDTLALQHGYTKGTLTKHLQDAGLYSERRAIETELRLRRIFEPRTELAEFAGFLCGNATSDLSEISGRLQVAGAEDDAAHQSFRQYSQRIFEIDTDKIRQKENPKQKDGKRNLTTYFSDINIARRLKGLKRESWDTLVQGEEVFGFVTESDEFIWSFLRGYSFGNTAVELGNYPIIHRILIRAGYQSTANKIREMLLAVNIKNPNLVNRPVGNTGIRGVSVSNRRDLYLFTTNLPAQDAETAQTYKDFSEFVEKEFNIDADALGQWITFKNQVQGLVSESSVTKASKEGKVRSVQFIKDHFGQGNFSRAKVQLDRLIALEEKYVDTNKQPSIDLTRVRTLFIHLNRLSEEAVHKTYLDSLMGEGKDTIARALKYAYLYSGSPTLPTSVDELVFIARFGERNLQSTEVQNLMAVAGTLIRSADELIYRSTLNELIKNHNAINIETDLDEVYAAKQCILTAPNVTELRNAIRTFKVIFYGSTVDQKWDVRTRRTSLPTLSKRERVKMDKNKQMDDKKMIATYDFILRQLGLKLLGVPDVVRVVETYLEDLDIDKNYVYRAHTPDRLIGALSNYQSILLDLDAEKSSWGKELEQKAHHVFSVLMNLKFEGLNTNRIIQQYKDF